jgi:hypothetical protein
MPLRVVSLHPRVVTEAADKPLGEFPFAGQARWVKQAQRDGKTLTEWIIARLLVGQNGQIAGPAICPASDTKVCGAAGAGQGTAP